MHNCQTRQKRIINIKEKNIVIRFYGLFIILWRYTPIMAYEEKIIYDVRNLFKKSENTGKICQYAGGEKLLLRIVFT